MNYITKIILIICMALFAAACSNPDKKRETTTTAPVQAAIPVPSPQPATANYKKGDAVPSNLVCMVNDAFMNKEQIAVPFNGKTYYGCCEMCKNRIPKDAAVRKATDPATGNVVDKASAYIVITGNNGEVSYFESADTYKKSRQHP